MPQDIQGVRNIQGRFQQHVAHRAGHAAYRAGRDGARPLHVRNSRDVMVAALLLSTAMSGIRSPHRAQRMNATAPEALPARAALLPGAQATPVDGYSRLGLADSAQALQSVSNTVAGGCLARPRQCGQALVAGAAAGIGVLAAGALGYVAGSANARNCPSRAVPAAAPAALSETALNALPAEDRQRVWQIVRACAGSAPCATAKIRALLEQLPIPVQQHLTALMAEPAQQARPAPAALPGAAAAPMPPAVNWMDQLATLLGMQISAEEATFELDIAALTEATVASQNRSNSIVGHRLAANEARLDAVSHLFESEGWIVEQRPFNHSTRSLFGQPYRSSGRNLRVTLSGPGPVQRTLLLMAHADVAAPDAGSTGAVDNGTGVAVLLAVARRVHAAGLPEGTCLQLLITDQEESGLHGAKAYVEECEAAQDCPTLTLNLDLLDRGDGLTLSGSNVHGFYRDGDSRPRGNDSSPVGPAEARMQQQLRAAAAAAGLRVHDVGNWTLQSDQIAFQRHALPAIGISLMDENDIVPERALQHAQDAFLQAEEAVDWHRYDDFLGGRLSLAEHTQMERLIDAADAAIARYQALPRSDRQRRIHSAADQPGQIDTRRALSAARVLHRAVSAWLAMPPPSSAD